MRFLHRPRTFATLLSPGSTAALALLLVAMATGSSSLAQAPAGSAHAAAPAGTDVAVPLALPGTVATQPDVSAKARREAEDAYIRGARALDRKDLDAAERAFQTATRLAPQDRDYAVALAVTREHRLTDLVQRAARAQKLGRTDEADRLLLDARAIDPENAVVRQHFSPDGSSLAAFPLPTPSTIPFAATRAADARSLAGPVALTPDPGLHSFHTRGGPQQILREVCTAFGLRPEFDASVAPYGQALRFDLDHADFSEASRTAEALTHTFLVPLQPKTAFFAKDTAENRSQLEPTEEETLFMPGASEEALSEYATLARNVFNLKTVTAVAPSAGLVLRGDPGTLARVNATLDDLVDGGADVLLEVNLYEVDSARTRTLGISPPASVGVFPVASEAQSLINANQSLIAAAIASNQLVLTSNPYTNAIEELGLLLASGVVSSSEFSNLLGVIGHYGGLPLAGVFLGATTTFNALLNSSDIRILDHIELRAEQGQQASFRAGTRYPIETGIYSSNLNSSLTSAAAGLSINGTSVSSLLSQYLGSSSVSVPQIQFEDLGLTLKATPQIERSSEVSLKLDLKVEALGSGSINTLPVLNQRQLTSQVSIPAGQTALLASLVNLSEQRSIDGLPFLSELPGFQGTEKSSDISRTELLITITPHIVRERHMEIASRRMLMPPDSGARGGSSGMEREMPQPERVPIRGPFPENERPPSPGAGSPR